MQTNIDVKLQKGKTAEDSPVWEEHCCPAGYEARLPGEPQAHQQGEDDQHRYLSKLHSAQLPVLLPHHRVRLPVSFGFPATAERVFEAEEKKWRWFNKTKPRSCVRIYK